MPHSSLLRKMAPDPLKIDLYNQLEQIKFKANMLNNILIKHEIFLYENLIP